MCVTIAIDTMNDFIITNGRGRIRSTPRAPLVAIRVVSARRPTPQAYNPVINGSVTTVMTAVVMAPQRLSEAVSEVIAQQLIVSPALRYGLARTARRAEVLSRAVAVQQPPTRSPASFWSRFKWPKLRRFAFGVLVVLTLAGTGYVGFDTWQTNNQAKAQLGQSANAAAADANPQARQTAEGRDEAPLPSRSLKNYVVAASLPRALYIDKLHVAARILPMSVNTDGSVQSPLNIFDSGWYNGSVQPGQIGAMFIDGHASGPTHQGLFGNLSQLAVGDTLQVEKGDGTRLTYKVVHTDIVDKDAVDMKSMLLPYGHTSRGLNLMTCAGTWITKGNTLSRRVLVYTEQIS